MTELEIVKGMRELLSDEKRWTIGSMAKDSEGMPVAPMSRRAVCWCASGAFDKVLDGDISPEHLDVWDRLNSCSVRVRASGLVGVNDVMGHVHVLAVLDARIASLEIANV